MEDIEVLCINCQNLINPEDISKHSRTCVTPVIFTKKSSNISLINSSLSRLTTAVSKIYAKTSDENTTVKNAIQRLITQIAKLEKLTHEDLNQDNSIEKIIDEVTEISSMPSLPVAVVFYSDRFKVLINKKENALIKESKKYDFLLEEESNVINEKNIGETFGQAKTQDFLEVNSVVEASKKSSFMSLSSIKSDDASSVVEVSLADVNSENDPMKKYFINLCNLIRFDYPSNHPSQRMKIHDMYEKFNFSKMPYEKWNEAINREFINAI